MSIAYQVVGDGALDIVMVQSAYAANADLAWEWSVLRDGYQLLAARGRLLLFDRRGSGLSDSVSGEHLPTLEARMEDIRAVMDAAGSERAVLYGLEDGAAHCFLFAATYPERTQAVITMGASCRALWAPEAPWGWTEERWAEELRDVEQRWGTMEFVQDLAEVVFPSRAHDQVFIAEYARMLRHSLRKADALAVNRMYRDTDVRHVLPTIQAPTLVMHLAGDLVEPIEEGHYIAERIPGAVLVELPGSDHEVVGDCESIDRFLADLATEEAGFDRVLSTVLFTDIVGSTTRAVEIGDRAWKDLLQEHNQALRTMLARYRGNEVDTAGDGFFGTFDGPARAVRCGLGMIGAVKSLGLEIRVGVHTGEVQTIDGKAGGIAVAIGARVAGAAGPSEVVVSSTVKDLVAGSGLVFADAGERELKGVPDRWRLYRVVT